MIMEMKESHIILDVRTPKEFAKAHIPGAINIPYDTIDDDVRAAIEKAGEDEVVFSIGSLYFSADIKNAAKRVLG